MGDVPKIKLDITSKQIKSTVKEFKTTANTNPETGIRYGVVQNNNIDGDVMQEMFMNSEPESLLDLKQELKDTLTGLLKDFIPEEELNNHIDCVVTDTVNLVCEQTCDYTGETRYGEYEGIKYYIFEFTTMIIESPVTAKFRLCSPCYPNACDIDNPDEETGYEGYTLPGDYFFTGG